MYSIKKININKLFEVVCFVKVKEIKCNITITHNGELMSVIISDCCINDSAKISKELNKLKIKYE